MIVVARISIQKWKFVTSFESKSRRCCEAPAFYEEEGDHLLELEEILERLEDAECPNISEDVYHRRKHDLCSGCYREYRKILSQSNLKFPIGFSDN